MAGVALLTAAGVLALPGAAAGAADSADALATTRYGGSDRYATSLRVAKALADLAGGKIDEVVMVSGRSWTDAVVAGPLAGARGGAVLSTPSASLRTDATEFLKSVGVKKAWLVGTESDSDGIGSGVVDALEELDIATSRVSGADRYETAVLVANALGTPGDMGDLGRTAIVASGLDFADALVAGPFAARGRHPILLSPSLQLHDSVAGYLTSASIEHVVLMGGTAALSASVETSVKELDIEVTRLAGASRYVTSVKAAEFVTDRYGKGCFSLQRTGLARARVPFDSFSAGPLLGRLCAPLLLADPKEVPAETGAYLDSARKSAGASTTPQLHVFGGDAAISQASINAYLDPDAARDSLNCVPELGDKPTLLLGGAYARRPAWSPDCSRIAYLDKEQAIWTANVDGSDPVRVTEGYTKDEDDDEPAWSPDGKKIAFFRYAGRFVAGDPVQHIFVVNANGSGERQLTTGDVLDASPAWSPDGKRMVFSRQNLRSAGTRDGYYEDTYLTVMDHDGRNQKQITPTGGDAWYPTWSPDGQHIAYNGNSAGLAFVTPEGDLPSGFIEEQSVSGAIAWSPSGDQIAYVRFEWLEGVYSGRRLVRESLDGSSLHSVVSYSHKPGASSFLTIYRPSWAPDGKSILFERNTNNGDRARAYAAKVAP